MPPPGATLALTGCLLRAFSQLLLESLLVVMTPMAMGMTPMGMYPGMAGGTEAMQVPLRPLKFVGISGDGQPVLAPALSLPRANPNPVPSPSLSRTLAQIRSCRTSA